MRIAGGTLRGRILNAPVSDFLRPTQDAVREAVFSMLAAVIRDACFLDLYAGTGAVGLEAWSRGARSILWVEQSPRSLKLLEGNAGKLLPPDALGNSCRMFRADVREWLKHPPVAPGSVDIVYLDPPYVTQQGGDDQMSATLAALVASGILAPRSFVVAEQRDGTPVPAAEGLGLILTRRYGRTAVSLFWHDG